ncbi:MAG: hypothetical protein HRU15_03715 [Planctomycetes bacterium]|nr:hypothetical protein [Planctomycetota bacterium]
MLPFKHGLSEDGDTVTLHKLKAIEDTIEYTMVGEDEGLKVLVLDTECTGLAEDDEMVEIGVAAFTVSEAGDFIKYHKTANWLNEPARQMHPEAVQVTGLTNESLKGERFDDEAIEKALNWCDIIIAHNAQYDYGKMKQRYSTAMRGKIWL